MKELNAFIEYLKNEGYEIKLANPKHVPGQGYSPAPYYSNVDIESVLNEFYVTFY